jgi:hypothetical protein
VPGPDLPWGLYGGPAVTRPDGMSLIHSGGNVEGGLTSSSIIAFICTENGCVWDQWETEMKTPRNFGALQFLVPADSVGCSKKNRSCLKSQQT